MVSAFVCWLAETTNRINSRTPSCHYIQSGQPVLHRQPTNEAVPWYIMPKPYQLVPSRPFPLPSSTFQAAVTEDLCWRVAEPVYPALPSILTLILIFRPLPSSYTREMVAMEFIFLLSKCYSLEIEDRINQLNEDHDCSTIALAVLYLCSYYRPI